jgi:outer membrane receptor for ferrienterochelin and colicin
MFRAFSGNSRADQVELGRILKCGVSAMALCAVAAATPVMAQTGSVSGTGTAGATGTATSNSQSGPGASPETGGAEEITVTGIRQSLANAQNIKRNSDTVVDAITAQDIGALPDRSVTEALQRVPGVAMNRFAGSNDPDHFSVEGSGVVVRGLNYVRSEFNGRDTFSAGVGGQ